MVKTECQKIIKQLVSFGTRQNAVALEASAYLQDILKSNRVSFVVKEYFVDLPVWEKGTLIADGVSIQCLPTGLTSGVLTEVDPKTTSLISSRHFFNTPHVNSNEQCNTISRANFSFAPSIAISKNDLERVINAKKIVGEIQVQKVKQKTEQILVGNLQNPKTIIFSHFDSIGTGAVDNASGTALCIHLLLKNKKFLEETLFVFDGNEELSYDAPTYWGKGYRNFEETYGSVMKTCKQILVVDCVGYAQTNIITEGEIVPLAFPIQNLETYANKIKLITSDYDRLMSVYHSDDDNGSMIQEHFLDEARQSIKSYLERV